MKGTWIVAVATAFAATPGVVCAQSLTVGAMAGTVQNRAGEPVFDVVVTVEPVAGGVIRADTTPRDGTFALDNLVPGTYEVLAERLGYRPQRVRGVMVRAGSTVQLAMEIEPVPGVPESADVVEWDGGITAAAEAALTAGASASALSALPGTSRTFEDASRLASFLGPRLESRGLPGSMTGFLVDGVPMRGARHALLGAGSARSALFRLSGFDQLQVSFDPVDAEVSGFAGAVVTAQSYRAGRELRVHGYAEGTAGAMVSSADFEAADADATTLRVGAALSGPIVADTAHFALGIEVSRDAVARAPLLDADLSQAAGSLLERLGTTYSGLGVPFSSGMETVSAFGSLDWQLTNIHRLSTRLDMLQVGTAEQELVGGGLTSTSSGLDFAVVGALTSQVGASSALEFRFGLDRSSRDYERLEGAEAVPFTAVANGSLAFGTDPSLGGSFRTSSVYLGESYVTRSEVHQIKLGVGAWLARHERTLVPAGPAFYFSDATGPVTGDRAYTVTRSPGPEAPSFTISQFFGFLQDRWSLSNEVDATFGVRVEYERLPLSDITVDNTWGSISGLDNVDIVEQPDVKFMPRFGLDWNVGGTGRIFLRAAAGIHHEMADPDIIAEILSEAGQRNIEIRTGTVGGWPNAATGGAVTELGLTSILAPGYRAPRSERGSVGLGVVVAPGLSLDVGGTYGRTSGLPTRTDLNRLPGRVGTDQDGRPIFGELVKDGALLYARPGTNRRLPFYDHVYAIDAEGTSNFYSVTAGLGYVRGGVTLRGDYTYSEATDDWLNAGLAPRDRQLAPFADDPAWNEGTADLDVTHRLIAELDLAVPGTPLRIASFYRFASGRPFTPGFPAGVDMNGDGVFGNDPAFVGGDVSSLTSEWPCLRAQAGGFAERNSCREPASHRIDLRVSVDLQVGAAGALSVFADGLNLIEDEIAIRDRALYRLDSAGALDRNPDTGRVTIPLEPNENFGEPLILLSTGRVLRLGLQLRY